MLRIRLAKGGEKKDPFYRIIAISKGRKRGGFSKNSFGFWHPRANIVVIDKKEIQKWVAKGAQLSKSVAKLLTK